MGSLAFCALPLRFATRHGAKELVGTCPVGFARAEGARSTHGYVPAAATRLTLRNSYRILLFFAQAETACQPPHMLLTMPTWTVFRLFRMFVIMS